MKKKQTQKTLRGGQGSRCTDFKGCASNTANSARKPTTKTRFKRTQRQREIAILGYTENNGNPFTALPSNYFKNQNHESLSRLAHEKVTGLIRYLDGLSVRWEVCP